jgi:hypothetical protein
MQGVSCTHPQLPGESCHGTHWTEGWVGPGVGVDTMDKRKSVTPARNWTLDCPAAAQSLYTSNYANPAPLFANIRQYPDRKWQWATQVSPDCSCTWVCHSHATEDAALASERQTAAAPHIPPFACQPTILLFLVSLSFLLLVFAISCAYNSHYPLPSFPTDFSFSPPILPTVMSTLHQSATLHTWPPLSSNYKAPLHIMYI